MHEDSHRVWKIRDGEALLFEGHTKARQAKERLHSDWLVSHIEKWG